MEIKVKMKKIKKSEIMKVYVVGDYGPEHNHIRSVHKTYDGALKVWNELRESLLEQAKSDARENKEDRDMYEKMVKNLSCTDPKKIDNFAQETPYIKEYDFEE